MMLMGECYHLKNTSSQASMIAVFKGRDGDQYDFSVQGTPVRIPAPDLVSVYEVTPA